LARSGPVRLQTALVPPGRSTSIDAWAVGLTPQLAPACLGERAQNVVILAFEFRAVMPLRVRSKVAIDDQAQRFVGSLGRLF
jgi:hypothetical protein